MEMMLQFGYGMMGLSQRLIEEWGGGSVILSPRDLSLEQMLNYRDNLTGLNSNLFFDPQFFVPRTDQQNLNGHTYWPEDYNTIQFGRDSIRRLIGRLNNDYNLPLNTAAFILPSALTDSIDEVWYKFQSIYVEEARRVVEEKPIYVTLAFSHTAIMSETNVHEALEYVEELGVQGAYVIVEPPNSQYLVDNPVWLLNLLDLTAGLKLLGLRVIVGYSNQQSLILALSNVDAIACGNWMNVRSFTTTKFNVPEGGPRRNSLWYYCPQALSEYQLSMMDLASRFGMIEDLRADPTTYGSNHAEILFSGAQPSTTAFNQRSMFSHYLTCVKNQAESAVQPTYNETMRAMRMRIESALQLTGDFAQVGINGRQRDFSNVADSQLSTIQAYNHLRGLSMSHNWNSL